MENLGALIIQAVLAALGGMAISIFSKLSRDIHDLTKTVAELNLEIAVVIEKIEHHDRRISSLETKKGE